MNPDFYNNYTDGFKYAEIGICIEDTNGPTCKLYIPILTPALSKNIAYDTVDSHKVNTTNIISDKKSLLITPCIESNYIEIKLPDDKPARKGDNFVVVFIGGNINNPVLIGRC